MIISHELQSLLTKLPEGQMTTLDLATEGVDKKVSVSLQGLLPPEPRAPKRAETPARKHEFLSAEALATYLARYGSEKTVVFADPAGERISAILEERAQGGVEIVTMQPQVHPLWAPWAKVAGTRQTLKAFRGFLDENRRAVKIPDGKVLALSLAQVRAAVSFEIADGRGNDSVNGVMVRSKVSGAAQSDNYVALPDELVLTVPLYVQTKPVDVELDLCIEADATHGVLVLVTAGGVAEARAKAFEQMVETVRAGIVGLKATLTFGRPAHEPWNYLDEPSEE